MTSDRIEFAVPRSVRDQKAWRNPSIEKRPIGIEPRRQAQCATLSPPMSAIWIPGGNFTRQVPPSAYQWNTTRIIWMRGCGAVILRGWLGQIGFLVLHPFLRLRSIQYGSVSAAYTHTTPLYYSLARVSALFLPAHTTQRLYLNTVKGRTHFDCAPSNPGRIDRQLCDSIIIFRSKHILIFLRIFPAYRLVCRKNGISTSSSISVLLYVYLYRYRCLYSKENNNSRENSSRY